MSPLFEVALVTFLFLAGTRVLPGGREPHQVCPLSGRASCQHPLPLTLPYPALCPLETLCVFSETFKPQGDLEKRGRKSPPQRHINVPGGLVVKNPPAHAGEAGDAGSIPGSGRSPGGRISSSLQCSCPENCMDRQAWRAAAHGVAESNTTERACIHQTSS